MLAAAFAAILSFVAPALADEMKPGPNGDLTNAACPYAGAIKPGPQPTTLIFATGTANGTLQDVMIRISSGDPDIDAAALACVKDWRFDPTTPLGKLNIGSIRLNMARVAQGNGIVLRRIGLPHTCMQDYPAEALKAGIGGKTIVHFFITVEGKVRDSSIDTSSGNAQLDAASLECVRYWRYRPAVKDGAPIEVPWKAEIRWIPPAPPPPADTQPKP